jgi:hypothetical protein
VIYVDDYRASARVGSIRARWSHLTADTPDELHRFAVGKLGMDRGWFQARCKHGKCPTRNGVCRHFHYDLVDRRRRDAIAAGAKAITYREFGALISARKAQFDDGTLEEAK